MSQTDKRIQQLLKKRQEDNEEVPRTSKTSPSIIKGDEGHIRRLQQKWTDDIHLLSSVVKSLNERLVLVDIKFSFVTRSGRPGTTVGCAEFGGMGPRGSGEISFDVFESGEVRAYFNRKPANQFYLLKADRHLYESILLDFAELLV